ncbi:hypothetical protein [Pseudomonas viciae]|uniref:hypothetical protein n=1 Tax=Pseudomonas viciae TaxID=2505979 RepID=UPI002234DF80|nr:hypothetical protein [Pseudomonas viciae]UZE84766.1 hypothetical protein LOY66_19470 [Pseudomonas viciae]
MPPPGSDSESDDDVDWSLLGSAFDTEEEKSQQTEGFVDIAFWEGLRTHRDGPNTLGFIQDDQTLKDELKASGNNNGGLLHISAFHKGDSFTLSGSPAPLPGSVPVYWLPWKKGTTVYAQRDWYEHSICQYFMTTKLTGCQFVITKKLVLHIASDANGAFDFDSGSGTRKAVREGIIGNAPFRKMSVTDFRVTSDKGKHFGYGRDTEGSAERKKDLLRTHALIFGMREKDGHWTYKSLTYSPGSRGVWEELIVPGDI